jgi:hypothetical protein
VVSLTVFLRDFFCLANAHLAAGEAGDGRAQECSPLPSPYPGAIFDANVQAWSPSIQGLTISDPNPFRWTKGANDVLAGLHLGGSESSVDWAPEDLWLVLGVFQPVSHPVTRL